MYFEQILKDVAWQYEFVKRPAAYIANVCEGEGFDIENLVQKFKNTKVFRKLRFELNDNEAVSAQKQRLVEAYVSTLKAAGLAIQSVLIKDIDNIYAQFGANADTVISDVYFGEGRYFDCIERVFPQDEGIFDEISRMIDETAFDNDEIIDKMRRYKQFCIKFTKDKMSDLQCLKTDISDNRGFNYKDVPLLFGGYFVEQDELFEDNNNDQAAPIAHAKQAVSMPAEKKAAAIAGGKNERKLLTVEDAIVKNFSGLVGLANVRSTILRKTKLIQKLPNKAVDCNFRITGNPGVGKTTVAMAMSKTFFDAGIIKKPDFVELNGAQLKGKYVGHTVGNVQAIFEKAKLGTLFLDEVYSLLPPKNDDEDSFTQEAITQLMIEVENLYKAQLSKPEDRTLIIMAGYKDKLDALLEKNIGFKRRFPNSIDIDDYSESELMEIFDIAMKNDGFNITPTALQEVRAALAAARKQKNFSNAGYVRNLLQGVEEFQAARADITDMTIQPEDVIASAKNLAETPAKHSSKIGFATSFDDEKSL